jgi:hypothetical protein
MQKTGRPSSKKCISCPVCEKEFTVHHYRLQKRQQICCSLSCKYKFATIKNAITRNCIKCGKSFSFVKSEEKFRPKIYCSHECMYKGKITNEITFYREKAFDNLPNKCYFCNIIQGRLEVHHIDKDRTNNNLSNLIIICKSCHKKLHLIS